MSAISGYISTIQNAVYGEQVRTAIINALTQCYSDVSNPSLNTAAFSAAIEAAYANGFLDIQEKATIAGMTNTKIIYRYTGNAAGYVHNALYYYDGTAWRPIGSGIQTASTAAQMTDTNAIYKYTGSESGYKNGAIYYYDGTSWVAIAKQEDIDLIFSGITVFKNLFNKNDSDILTDSATAVSNNSGTIISASGYSVSGYIPVTAGTYSVPCSSNHRVILFYDENKTLFHYETRPSKTDANGRNYVTFSVDSAKYIRFTYLSEIINEVMAVRLDTMPTVYADYNTVGVQLSGKEANTQTVEMEMEGGTIADSGASAFFGRESTTIASFNNRKRSKYFVATGGASRMSLDLGEYSGKVSSVYLAKFDSNKALIEAETSQNDLNNIILGNAKYIRIVLVMSENNVPFTSCFATFYNSDGTARQAKKPKFATDTEQILYPMTKDICNTGRLALPPNYDSDGDPVPLVIFMHGSGHYLDWDTTMTNYSGLLEYIQKSGFAVLELYSWTSKYYNKYGTGLNGCDPYPIKITLDAYREGMKYVCDCWNIDINNIHVMSKSSGGQLAYHFANYAPFPIRSIGMFSPVLDYLSMRGASGVGQSFGDPRRAIVEELGLTGDAENNFVNTKIYADNCVAFLQGNIEKLNSINEAWQGLIGQTLQDKFDTAIDNCEKWWSNKTRDDVYTDYTLAKLGKYPVKIWGTPTDTDTPYQKMVEAVKQLNNGGCEAHLRTFASGGHNVTDSGAAAAGEIETNVTTRLGVEFASVPTAYVENLDWILLHMNEVDAS